MRSRLDLKPFRESHIRRTKDASKPFPKAADTPYRFKHLKPGMGIYPNGVISFYRFDNAETWFLCFLDECAEYTVPNDENAGIIPIQILLVHPVMNAVMRRGVQDVFKPSDPMNESRMYPELIDQVKSVHRGEHPRGETKQHYRSVEYPMQYAAKPALPDRYAQIVMLARVVDDVKIPKQPYFVARPMKYVVGEIVNEQQGNPGPPRVRRKLERGQIVCIKIDIAGCQAKEKPPDNAHETQEDIGPGVLVVVELTRATPTGVDCFQRDHRREYRYS
jgi:hypothetical protein